MSDIVERLRESGSRSEIELHEDREEAADSIEELEAKLDEAVWALEPYAQLAKHHAADAPEWGPFDSVTAQVSVMNLRAARAALAKLKGENQCPRT
jgi:multidrug resistance efflux pump